MVEWETEETTIESLYIIASYDPVVCDLCANEMDVLQK